MASGAGEWPVHGYLCGHLNLLRSEKMLLLPASSCKRLQGKDPCQLKTAYRNLGRQTAEPVWQNKQPDFPCNAILAFPRDRQEKSAVSVLNRRHFSHGFLLFKYPHLLHLLSLLFRSQSCFLQITTPCNSHSAQGEHSQQPLNAHTLPGRQHAPPRSSQILLGRRKRCLLYTLGRENSGDKGTGATSLEGLALDTEMLVVLVAAMSRVERAYLQALLCSQLQNDKHFQIIPGSCILIK